MNAFNLGAFIQCSFDKHSVQIEGFPHSECFLSYIFAKMLFNSNLSFQNYNNISNMLEN